VLVNHCRNKRAHINLVLLGVHLFGVSCHFNVMPRFVRKLYKDANFKITNQIQGIKSFLGAISS
jgi:hypothetical protein